MKKLIFLSLTFVPSISLAHLPLTPHSRVNETAPEAAGDRWNGAYLGEQESGGAFMDGPRAYDDLAYNLSGFDCGRALDDDDSP